MIVEFSVVDTKDFTIEHLFDSPENQDLIANFQATNDAAGLEDYLKIQSVEDEENRGSVDFSRQAAEWSGFDMRNAARIAKLRAEGKWPF